MSTSGFGLVIFLEFITQEETLERVYNLLQVLGNTLDFSVRLVKNGSDCLVKGRASFPEIYPTREVQMSQISISPSTDD
jgi:hypothetical protein